MSNDINERDEHGDLTDWALAADALIDNGCDCGTDEPGTCLACVCERAMRTERAKVERLTAERDDARRQAAQAADFSRRYANERDRLREELEAEEIANRLAAHSVQDAYERERDRLRRERNALKEAVRVVLDNHNTSRGSWSQTYADGWTALRAAFDACEE